MPKLVVAVALPVHFLPARSVTRVLSVMVLPLRRASRTGARTFGGAGAASSGSSTGAAGGEVIVIVRVSL